MPRRLTKDEMKKHINVMIESQPPVDTWLSTGSTLLDLAVANKLPGGIPAGRITHLWGLESSGKTLIVCEALGSAIRHGGRAILVDSEGTFDASRAMDLYGVDIKKLQVIEALNSDKPEDRYYLETLFDVTVKNELKIIHEKGLTGKGNMIGIDSLSAITCEKEAKKDLADGGAFGGGRPNILSAGFRKYMWLLSGSGLGILAIDQCRRKFGQSGGGWTFAGGEAMKYYASTRIFLRVCEHIKNRYDKVEGVKILFRVEKNKVGPPFRVGTFRVLFDYGIDDVSSSLEWIRENPVGKDESNRSWYRCPDGKKFQDLRKAAKYLEEKEQEEKLRDIVCRRWNKLYPLSGRVRRARW